MDGGVTMINLFSPSLLTAATPPACLFPLPQQDDAARVKDALAGPNGTKMKIFSQGELDVVQGDTLSDGCLPLHLASYPTRIRNFPDFKAIRKIIWLLIYI